MSELSADAKKNGGAEFISAPPKSEELAFSAVA
jgi:hypothetical protein